MVSRMVLNGKKDAGGIVFLRFFVEITPTIGHLGDVLDRPNPVVRPMVE